MDHPPPPLPSEDRAVERLERLTSAARKADAAGAVLADRRCAAHDAVPLLHLGFQRLAEALQPEREVPSSLEALSLPGLTPAQRARAGAALGVLEKQQAAIAGRDPQPVDRAELLFLTFALGRAALAARRALAPAQARAPWRRSAVLASAGLAVLLCGGAVFALAIPRRKAAFGWRAAYFRNHDFKGTPLERIDPEVAFFWDEGAPLSSFPADHFTVRWTGCLRVDGDGSATFALGSDDESRLFVDGKQLIDNWHAQGMTWARGTLHLSRGVHRLRVDYGEEAATASVMLKLGWNGKLPEAIDPSLILLPGSDPGASDPCLASR